MKNTRTKIQLLILAVTVILSVTALMYLPDVAAVQWNSAGATNYLPKLWAVVVPPVSSLIAILFWCGNWCEHRNDAVELSLDRQKCSGLLR